MYLLLYLKEYPNIKLVAYAFLPNHFHFVIKNISEWKELSDFMKKLQWRYSTWYRVKYPIEYKQPVFEWRFKAKRIDTEEYLYQCIAYVNYNPVKHEIVTDIKDYPYTSYHQFVDKQKFTGVPVPQLDELEF
jgi:putative transposase